MFAFFEMSEIFMLEPSNNLVSIFSTASKNLKKAITWMYDRMQVVLWCQDMLLHEKTWKC